MTDTTSQRLFVPGQAYSVSTGAIFEHTATADGVCFWEIVILVRKLVQQANVEMPTVTFYPARTAGPASGTSPRNCGHFACWRDVKLRDSNLFNLLGLGEAEKDKRICGEDKQGVCNLKVG